MALRVRVAVLLGMLLGSVAIGKPAKTPEELARVLGVTHVSGKYYLTDEDFLNEGADRILELGSKVIKLWFDNPANSYPFNSHWPEIHSLVDIAKTPYFSRVFDKDFDTYILMAFSVGKAAANFRDGMSQQEIALETEQFYGLTKYLLTRYKGTGKTFVLQHWEGDWLIRGNYKRDVDPDPVAIKGMIEWLNARQAGVDKARKEVGQHGVKVYHAAEVNLVVATMDKGRPGLIDKVIPYTHVDLVSYSAWDSVIEGWRDPNLFRRALDFIAAHTPDSPDFGDKNVYVGEFGIPENEFSPEKVRAVLTNAVETSLDWGCPYVVYWQLYCNEIKQKGAKPPIKDNSAMRGFWMIRPDGSKSWAWDYYHRLLSGKPAKQPQQ